MRGAELETKGPLSVLSKAALGTALLQPLWVYVGGASLGNLLAMQCDMGQLVKSEQLLKIADSLTPH